MFEPESKTKAYQFLICFCMIFKKLRSILRNIFAGFKNNQTIDVLKHASVQYKTSIDK